MNGYNKWLSRMFWIGVLLIVVGIAGVPLWFLNNNYPAQIMAGIFIPAGTALLGIEKWKNTVYGIKQLEAEINNKEK